MPTSPPPVPPSYTPGPGRYPTSMPPPSASSPLFPPAPAPPTAASPPYYPPAGGAPSAYPGYAPNTYPPGQGRTAVPYASAGAYTYCLVCGAPLPGMNYSYCPTCFTPVGTLANPNDPTATTFLALAEVQRMNPTTPVSSSVQPTGIPAMPLPNAVPGIPEDAKQGWNWGAALLTTPWAFRHRVWWAAILGGMNLLLWVFFLVAIAASGNSSSASSSDPSDDTALWLGGIMLAGSGLFWLLKTLYLGLNGNGLAWKTGLYRDVAQMRKVQKVWAGWGFLIAVMTVVIFIAVVAAHS
ncbi:MAG TPA: hypothetical protein VKU00_25570 [Chthonomonadaceae bacterium]|nr:hypothetical protein [Chthonomonadaceae bacterium]